MSRKLDAAIAEALGYEVFENLQEWRNKGMPHITEWSEVVEYPAYWNEAHESAICVPCYSTDGNAILELDREMRERGFVVLISTYQFLDGPKGKVVAKYYKQYCNPKNSKDVVDAFKCTEADTMPLAVALAAYKALMGKDWSEEVPD